MLDTHTLLWWALDPDKLSTTATAILSQLSESPGAVSAISYWELALEVKRGQLELPCSVEELARRVEETGCVEAVPVDTAIWLKSAALDWAHRDPADRVIVATALSRSARLVTKDELIRGYPGVETVW